MKKEDPVSAHDQEPTLQRETKTIPSEVTPAVTARKKKKRVLTAQLHPEDLKCKECGKTFPVMYKLEVGAIVSGLLIRL